MRPYSTAVEGLKAYIDKACKKCGNTAYNSVTDKCITCNPRKETRLEYQDSMAKIKKQIERKRDKFKEKREQDPYNYDLGE